VARPTSSSNNANNMKDNVLGANSFGKLAVHSDTHVLALSLQESLRGHDMFDLGSADTEGKSTKGSVSWQK